MSQAFTSYNSYVLVMAEMAAINDVNEPNFQAILPAMIDYAEQRIYRDLNLLATITRATVAATPNSRNVILPQVNGANFVAVQGVNVMIGTQRASLVPKSRYFVDFFNGGNEQSVAGQNPMVYAMLTDQIILIAPAPGSAMTVEIVGTVRLTALSASNQQTFLTQNLPDLFLAASMVFLSGFQKNFGAQADAPQASQSWESQYQNLRKSANDEEIRKRYNTAVNYPAISVMAASPTN